LRMTVLLACLLVLLCGASAAVVHVPNDAPRVSAALSIAAPYDTILVAPGTYLENIVWPSKPGIKLLSEAGREGTVLDGRGRAQVIGIYSGVDTTTVIRGFTIRNGHAEGM
jgi:hypothetical protein